MVEQAGTSTSAFAAMQDGLVVRHSALVDADALLSAVVTEAHAATADAVQQLDAISAEIASAVAQQDLYALDTSAGSREFQHFLLAKQQQILAIVTDAAALAQAKALEIRQLQARYGPETGA